MTKYHINKKGVPAQCKAQEGKCPLGGADGNQNHFDNFEDAEKAALKQGAAEFSHLPGIPQSEEKVVLGYQELMKANGSKVEVEYDGKKFSGEVISSRWDNRDDDNSGLIIKSEDGVVKHIKTGRMTKLTTLQERPALDIPSKGKELISNLSKNSKVVTPKEFNRGKSTFKSIGSVDTMADLRAEFVTSEEHDPVANVQSKFNHVAGKAGKLYRYEEEGNYLETHNYDFEGNIRKHKDYLESNGYFDDYVGGEGFEEKTPREAFAEEVERHRKMDEYTSKLAIEYGKDFEKNVATKPYSLEEKNALQKEYSKALADKIGAFVENYGDED